MAAPRLDAKQLQMLQNVTRQFPEFYELLSTWRSTELETLPFAVGSVVNLNVLQGRVQVLTEMQKLLASGNP